MLFAGLMNRIGDRAEFLRVEFALVPGQEVIHRDFVRGSNFDGESGARRVGRWPDRAVELVSVVGRCLGRSSQLL